MLIFYIYLTTFVGLFLACYISPSLNKFSTETSILFYNLENKPYVEKIDYALIDSYMATEPFDSNMSAEEKKIDYVKRRNEYISILAKVERIAGKYHNRLTRRLVKMLANQEQADRDKLRYTIKWIGLITSLINLFITIIMFFLYHFSSIYFQFVRKYENIDLIIKDLPFDLFLGIDGTSMYFIMLIGIIVPIAILSNWKSILNNTKSYIVIILLLEVLLVTVFLVLDTLSFYIYFESILPPLFLLLGFFGSNNKVKASYYLFIYTLLGSLFMLLSILTTISLMGVSDYNALYKTNFNYITQVFLFIGIFIAFAVKTPTIFLNIWLLKAHVESPLGGSIILAAIVLKLSLYGIMRLILPVLPKATYNYTTVIYTIAVITILYASVSTLRTVDIKELIAYSSVSHAAVYILGIFSNIIIGIQGAIVLGLAHGFISSGLFISAGGVLYDRASTRLITCYRGMTQLMPIYSLLFFILCLGNSGTPLTLNFIGEFMCLYGGFEQLPVIGAIGCSSIVFSAAYTMYMYNRIAFGGYYSNFFKYNVIDVNKREFYTLFILIVFAILLGIYAAPILDGLHFAVSNLLYIPSNGIDSICAFAACVYYKQRYISYKKPFKSQSALYVIAALRLRTAMNEIVSSASFSTTSVLAINESGEEKGKEGETSSDVVMGTDLNISRKRKRSEENTDDFEPSTKRIRTNDSNSDNTNVASSSNTQPNVNDPNNNDNNNNNPNTSVDVDMEDGNNSPSPYNSPSPSIPYLDDENIHRDIDGNIILDSVNACVADATMKYYVRSMDYEQTQGDPNDPLTAQRIERDDATLDRIKDIIERMDDLDRDDEHSLARARGLTFQIEEIYRDYHRGEGGMVELDPNNQNVERGSSEISGDQGSDSSTDNSVVGSDSSSNNGNGSDVSSGNSSARHLYTEPNVYTYNSNTHVDSPSPSSGGYKLIDLNYETNSDVELYSQILGDLSANPTILNNDPAALDDYISTQDTESDVKDTEFTIKDSEFGIKSTESDVKDTEFTIKDSEPGIKSNESDVKSTESDVKSNESVIQNTSSSVIDYVIELEDSTLIDFFDPWDP